VEPVAAGSRSVGSGESAGHSEKPLRRDRDRDAEPGRSRRDQSSHSSQQQEQQQTPQSQQHTFLPSPKPRAVVPASVLPQQLAVSAGGGMGSMGGGGITRQQLQQHTGEQDGWMVVRGMVWDVSGFARRHPGGRGMIMPYLGKDGTSPFESQHRHIQPQKYFRLVGPYAGG
jgi:cytochrome b involved in lipid metabolism